MCNSVCVNAESDKTQLARIERNKNAQNESVLFRRLPPAIQNMITTQWQALRKELEQEELLFALESFSRFMAQAPEPAPACEHKLETLVRMLLERIGLRQIMETTDEEFRYRLNLLQEFFAEALTRLSQRQRRIVRLTANAGHSFAEIARVMEFTSVAAVEAFQHSAYRAIATTLAVLFSLELQQPQVESRRRNALLQWQEVFAKQAAASF